ncbi:MAG: hypothetical protein CM1200mP29_05980 [Verrucomicrobiota bacterium]|nr:MAG: hypothetical protein CM1200mP29_05980 [Verrucomicrobiota bacterium]
MANSAKTYRAMLDGLEYRGTAFFSQSYTTCQPEHGVGRPLVRRPGETHPRSRGMPEFVYNPRAGELISGMSRAQGQPDHQARLVGNQVQVHRRKIQLHRRALGGNTEARFRKHLKAIPESSADEFIHIDNMPHLHHPAGRHLPARVRRGTLSYVPDFGVYFKAEVGGKFKYFTVSRQMVLFAIERRKAWRMLQRKGPVSRTRIIRRRRNS